MAMQSSRKWIIAIVAIIIILIIVYVIYKSTNEDQSQQVTTTTTTTSPGLLGTTGLAGVAAWLGGLFGGNKPTVNCVNGCDQNKFGYDCSGFPSPDCGFGRYQQQ